VSATLVTIKPRDKAAVTMRSARPLPEAELRALTEAAREAHETLAGVALADEDMLVRFTGPGIGQGEDANVELKSRLFVPLRREGRHAGVLLVATTRENAFDRDDE